MKKSSLFNTCVLAGTLLLQLIALCFHAHGAAGDVDLSFDPGSGVDDEVYMVAAQPDGKVLIGGHFTTVRGLARPYLARLNADGSGDATFHADTAVDRYVSAIALQPDGRVIFTRDFYNVVGAPPGIRVGRLNSDGTLDSSFVADLETFPEGSGFTCVALQPDGKVVLGGYSNHYYIAEDGFGYYYRRSLLIRLNANGSADPGVMSGNGMSGRKLYAVALQVDGKILIAGDVAGTVDGGYLIRLNANGTVDDSFDYQSASHIHAVAVRPDGRIFIGGGLIGVATGRNAISRLNANGSPDGDFHSGLDLGVGAVVSLVAQSDGKVVIGGPYLYVNGVDQNGVARLNEDGGVDSSFNPGTGTDAPNNAVWTLASQPDGKLFIAGGFTTFDGASRERIARLNADGSVDEAFDPGAGISAGVDSIVTLPAGNVLISGSFTRVAGASRNRIARLHFHGGLDSGFNPGTGISSAHSILRLSAVAIQPNGKVIIGGDFSVVDGVGREWLARLNVDGVLDSSFSFGTGWPAGQSLSAPQAIVMQPDGRILVGGFSGADPNGIARLNSDGSMDSSFHPDTIGNTGADWTEVSSVVVQPDGKILAGGVYANAVGWENYYNFLVTRLNADGSRDTGFTGTGNGFGVRSMALQPDGRVLVGSSLWEGTSGPGIDRLNANGSLDVSFDPGSGANGTVNCIVLQPNGRILIGGPFSSVNGVARNGIARLNADGSLDSTFNPGTGANGEIRAIALQLDGSMLIGGDFTAVNGVVRPHLARLYGDTRPPLPFAAWAESFGLSGGSAAADADPDKDGIANADEYVLGGNPTLPDAVLHPAITLSGGNMVFTFPRVDASETPGVTLTVESGTDLLTWPAVFHIGSNTTASSPGVSISENSTAPDTISVTIPGGAGNATFARLKITIVP